MTKFGKFIFTLIVVAILAVVIFFLQKKPAVAPVVENPIQTPPIVDTSMPPIGNKDLILGNKDDLVSFSITPGQEVSGKINITGSIKGGYFFEGEIGISVLGVNKKAISGIPYGPGYGTATGEWMTAGPVSLAFDLDFTNLPKGKAYIAITENDPSDASERGNTPIKQILIPIVIR